MSNIDKHISHNNDSFSNDLLKEITSFLNISPRSKLVFVRNIERTANIPRVNLGEEVASFIVSSRETDDTTNIQSFIKQLIAERATIHPELGKFIFLTNIGILFEPELSLDVELILSNLSRNILLLLDWKGEFKLPYLYFLTKNSKNRIKISNLNYISI